MSRELGRRTNLGRAATAATNALFAPVWLVLWLQQQVQSHHESVPRDFVTRGPMEPNGRRDPDRDSVVDFAPASEIQGLQAQGPYDVTSAGSANQISLPEANVEIEEMGLAQPSPAIVLKDSEYDRYWRR